MRYLVWSSATGPFKNLPMIIWDLSIINLISVLFVDNFFFVSYVVRILSNTHQSFLIYQFTIKIFWQLCFSTIGSSCYLFVYLNTVKKWQRLHGYLRNFKLKLFSYFPYSFSYYYYFCLDIQFINNFFYFLYFNY